MDTTVLAVQKMLNALGYAKPLLVEDGIMGDKTKTAIILFQEASSLKADGVVGPNTLNELKADYNDFLSKKQVVTQVTPSTIPNSPIIPAQSGMSDQTKKYIVYGAIGLGTFFTLITVLSMFKKPKA